jgi:hypothetical protein
MSGGLLGSAPHRLEFGPGRQPAASAPLRRGAASVGAVTMIVEDLPDTCAAQVMSSANL